MLSHIHDHYNQRLTLAALARTLRRRSTYLGGLFRKEVGMTVHEYVTRARMVFGAAHVCSGVKIEAAALNLGYRSKKNFYRQFKRFFGMTPEAYRHDRGRAGSHHSNASREAAHRAARPGRYRRTIDVELRCARPSR